MATLRERQEKLREEAITETMHDLLIQKGYAATSMEEVAAQLGIGKATLYRHFKSKEELALRVIVKQIEEAESTLQTLDPQLPAIRRLELSLRAGFENRLKMGQARIELLPEVVLSNPDFQAAQQRIAAASDAVLEEAKQQGAIRSELPTPLLREFISSVFSIPFETLVTREGLEPKAMVDSVVEMVLNALRG